MEPSLPLSQPRSTHTLHPQTSRTTPTETNRAALLSPDPIGWPHADPQVAKQKLLVLVYRTEICGCYVAVANQSLPMTSSSGGLIHACDFH